MRAGSRHLLALLATGCAVPTAAEVDPRLHVEGAVLTLEGGGELRAAQATMDPQGQGEGAVVTGIVPAGGASGDAPPLQIEAPRSRWELAARTARFEGGVVVTRADVRLTCDVLEVEYGGPDRLERAVATGSVRVERGERVATGDRAELVTATGRIELTGSPRLSEGPNRLSGERIVLWLDDQRVECDDCRLVVDGAAVAPERPGGR